MPDSLTVLVYARFQSSHCCTVSLCSFQSMSDSLTVFSVYVRQSHCVSLCHVSFSLCRTVSLCWFQSMSDSLTVLVYSLLVSVYVYVLVSVYVGQSHCVSLCLVSFSLCRTVCVSLFLVSFSLCRTVSLC